MPEFWISRVTQGLPIFVNKTWFWIWVGMQLWKGSEYSRIPNTPDFCKCKRYARFWMCLNMAEKSLNKRFWLWQGSEYGWSKFQRVLNMHQVPNIPMLWIWQGCGYAKVTQGACWIYLNTPQHVLIMPQYAWICLNNAEYAWICLQILGWK